MWAPAAGARLGMGGIGFALMLIWDFGFVLWLRGLTIGEYLATRDPVAGTVYHLTLGVFAVMPLLVGRKYPPIVLHRRPEC